ncbi:MAG: phosphatase PAP2 family protein [Candidatus Woesearchaeota archaeon]
MNFPELYHKYNREIWLTLTTIVWVLPYIFINKISVGRTEMSFNIYFDSVFPVLPVMVLIYVSSFVMVFMPYFFVKEKERFKAVAKGYLVAMLVGYITFLLLPIKALRPLITNTDIFSKMLQVLYSQDLPYNSFPSLHVGLSMLSALIIIHENKKWGREMLIWAVLIAISTLATKQHTLADVMGGIAVSLLGYFVFLRIIKNESHQSTRIIEIGSRSY